MTRHPRIWTWANALSLVRLPLAVAFPLTSSPTVRGTLLVCAAAADLLDGQIARHYNQGSQVGEVLDPVADKVFMGTALLTVLVEGALSLGQVAILLARDVYSTLGWFALMTRKDRPRVKSRWPGKLVTVLQLTTLMLVLLAPRAVAVGVAVTAPVAAWAIVDYTIAVLRSLRGAERAP